MIKFKGVVRDSKTFETLPGATIQVGPQGQSTDANGRFDFSLKEDKYLITIRYTGYKIKQMLVPLLIDFDAVFYLERDTTALPEVTIVSTKTNKWLYIAGIGLLLLFIFNKNGKNNN